VQKTFLKTFLLHLIQWRIGLLCVGLVLSGVAAQVGRQLALDRSIQHMFASDDPILKPYLQLQQTFGRHEIVMVVYSDPTLKSPDGLDRLRSVARQAREIPGVVAVVSLLDLPGAGIFSAAEVESENIGAQLRKVFSGYTHNQQLDAAGLVCLLSPPGTTDQPRREALQGLRNLIAELPDGALVGEPVLVEEAFDLLEADGQRLNTWCTVLLLITLLVCFGRIRWLILPLVVVQMTLALTRGLLVLLDLKLTMVSSMLPAIITVVGVATVIHVIVRFQDAMADGLTPREAMLRTGRLLAAPIVFACLTDAAGFAALMVSQVGPVYDFGLMMAIGSSLVLVSVALAVPGLVLIGNSGAAVRPAAYEAGLRRSLRTLLAWSIRHVRRLIVLGIGLTIVAAVGANRLNRETDFTKNFRQESSLVQAYQFVETRFGGAGVWDILIPAPSGLERTTLSEILALEHRLRAEIPQLTKAISLATILEASTAGLQNDGPSSPLIERGKIQVSLMLMRARMPEFVRAIYHEPPQDGQPWIRMLLRTPERLEATEKSHVIEQVKTIAADAFPESQVTGYYVLLTQLIESLLRDQWKTFGVATAAIVAMMLIGFRSIRLAIVALVPNALPVLMVFGGMGWLGVQVNMGAAMIAAVSLGLSVDGSIHYIMSYQRMRRSGDSVAEALAAVQETVGLAATFSTLALVVGFCTLVFSEFVPTIYFGALVSLSMIGGWVGNLVVLPVLIQLVDTPKKVHTSPTRI